MAGPSPAGGYSRNVKRESAGSALIQVIIVGAIVGAGVFFYARHQREEARVMELAVKAKEATAADDAPALLKAQKLFSEIGSEEKLTGNNAILSSLAELESQLFQTYGIKESKDKSFGYNAATDTYEDLIKSGVIDPTKVTRTALQNAASIAGLLLTTECVVVEKKEDKPASAGGPPGGGMGGMY